MSAPFRSPRQVQRRPLAKMGSQELAARAPWAAPAAKVKS
jgi:hypothetical protein